MRVCQNNANITSFLTHPLCYRLLFLHIRVGAENCCGKTLSLFA